MVGDFGRKLYGDPTMVGRVFYRWFFIFRFWGLLPVCVVLLGGFAILCLGGRRPMATYILSDGGLGSSTCML